MDRRQNIGRRCQIVQEFVKTISSDTQRLVCFLYMKGYVDGEIRRTLRLPGQTLDAVKLQLAFDLKKAGIRLAEA